MADFVRSGKGLAVVHGSSYAFSGLDILGPGHVKTGRTEPPWPEWAEMVGGTWAGNPPSSFHAPRHLFTVKFTDRDHPIARGMSAQFQTLDELYHGMRFLPGAHPIATAYDDPAIGGTGKEEPILVTTNFGKGRVFYTALGHEVPGMQEAGFAITFVRGAEWAATGEVTLPPEFPEARAARPLRIQVVTGGHTFDPEFYELFVNRPDLEVTVTGHPDAYTQRPPESPPTCWCSTTWFRRSARRGKPISARFSNRGAALWCCTTPSPTSVPGPGGPSEVVGGKYLEQPEAGRPASTYKHDEDLYVETVGQPSDHARPWRRCTFATRRTKACGSRPK